MGSGWFPRRGRAEKIRFPLIFGTFLVGTAFMVFNFKFLFKDRIAAKERNLQGDKYSRFRSATPKSD